MWKRVCVHFRPIFICLLVNKKNLFFTVSQNCKVFFSAQFDFIPISTYLRIDMGPQWRQVPHHRHPIWVQFLLKLGETISTQTFISNLHMEFHVNLLQRVHTKKDLQRKEWCSTIQEAQNFLKWGHSWKKSTEEAVMLCTSYSTIWKYHTRTISQKEWPNMRIESMLYKLCIFNVWYIEQW